MKQKFEMYRLAIGWLFFLVSATSTVSVGMTGGATHGGGNYEYVNGTIELFDKQLYEGTQLIEVKKQAFWPELKKLLDYLDQELPGIYIEDVNYNLNRLTGFYPGPSLWLGDLRTSQYLDYVRYIIKSLRITQDHQPLSKALGVNFFWNGFGTQLKNAIDLREWYIESKPLAEIGCINRALTQESKTLKIGACQDDFEVRLSEEFLKGTSNKLDVQAGMVLHELLRIYFKSIILKKVKGGSIDDSQSLLSQYGLDLLDKLVIKTVVLTLKKAGAEALLKGISKRLNGLEISFLTSEGSALLHDIYHIQNEKVCRDSTPKNTLQVIDDSILKEVNKKLTPYRISIEGNYFNGTQDLIGSAEDIYSFYVKMGSPFLFLFKEMSVDKTFLVNTLVMQEEYKVHLQIQLPMAEIWRAILVKGGDDDSVKTYCRLLKDNGLM